MLAYAGSAAELPEILVFNGNFSREISTIPKRSSLSPTNDPANPTWRSEIHPWQGVNVEENRGNILKFGKKDVYNMCIYIID